LHSVFAIVTQQNAKINGTYKTNSQCHLKYLLKKKLIHDGFFGAFRLHNESC